MEYIGNKGENQSHGKCSAKNQSLIGVEDDTTGTLTLVFFLKKT